MAIKLSRGPQVDTEKCIKNVDNNRFNLILIVAARARELARQNRANGTHTNEIVPSLLEVQSGKIGVEYLRKIR